MSAAIWLARLLALGSAQRGVAHWWAQRLSAVMLVPLLVWFLLSLLSLGTIEYGAILEWLGRPLNGVLLSVFVIVVLYHSKLGVQVVVEDYVHKQRPRRISLVLMTVLHLVVGVIGLYAVFRIAFGG